MSDLIECCRECESKDIDCMSCYNGNPCFECPKYEEHKFGDEDY